MSLWVDKWRPKTLNKLSLHKGLNENLRKFVDSNDLPHLLFCGPSGAGKKTRIHAILYELYGSASEKIKMDFRSFETPSGKKIELQILSSNYHTEINPSDVGIYDRVIVQEIVKEMAQTHQLSIENSSNLKPFKVLVINEADCLTKDAQHALRRTMEKYMNNMRIILCCSNPAKLIGPIKSRCLIIRVPSPSSDEIRHILLDVIKKERIVSPPSEEVISIVVKESGGNLQKALLMLECSKAFSTSNEIAFHEMRGGDVPLADWEYSIAEISNMLIQEQSIEKLTEIRSKLYELLTHAIPPSIILSSLTFILLKKIDQELKVTLLADAAEYESRIQQGQKAIFHLEAFVAKFMSTYKKFITDMCMNE